MKISILEMYKKMCITSVKNQNQNVKKNIAERIKRQRYSQVIKEEKDANMVLFQKYFSSLSPSQILKSFYNTNDKKEYFFSNTIKSRLSRFKR